MSQYTFHPELIEAIREDELIVFVGAGLSYPLKNKEGQAFGGWNDLVERSLQHLEQEGYDVAPLLQLVGRYDPIVILDLIQKDRSLSEGKIRGFLKTMLALHETENDYSLHRQLFELSKKILTTNYDTCFETAVPQLRSWVAYQGRNYELTKQRSGRVPLLFKLHGCVENAGSMVLFPSDYDALYNNPNKDAEHALLVLKNIIVNKTVLFIGCGMGDFQINSLFAEIKRLKGPYNQKHFIISKTPIGENLGFLHQIPIQEFSEIPDLIAELVDLKRQHSSRKSPEALQLEEQLQQVQEELERLKGKSLEVGKKLEREALKYFSEGLELHLSGQHKKAIDKYECAIDLNPNYPMAYNNWGNALVDVSKQENRFDWYQDSLEKYAKAVQLDPQYAPAYYNWGTTLLQLAKEKRDKKLFEESFDKFAKAAAIKPQSVNILYNWGTALLDLGRQEGDANRYRESFDKFAKAAEIDSQDAMVYYNWGCALSELAKALGNDEALDRESGEKLERCVELGGNAYNLACWYAIRQEKDQALKYLKQSMKKRELPPAYVLEDTDWKTYWEDEDFLLVLNES